MRQENGSMPLPIQLRLLLVESDWSDYNVYSYYYFCGDDVENSFM